MTARLRHQWSQIGTNAEHEPIQRCLLCKTVKQRRYSGRDTRTGKNYAWRGCMETVWDYPDGTQTVQSVCPPCMPALFERRRLLCLHPKTC